MSGSGTGISTPEEAGTLIVEDGSNVTGAESYISVADADIYFLARGVTAWAAALTLSKESALRLATEYMIATYRNRWQGYRTYPLIQALCWPRVGVVIERVWVYSDVVPETIKRACAELALRALSDDLLPDISPLVKKETVGPITVEYDVASFLNVRYTIIDAMLLPYLQAGGSGPSMRLERA